MNLDTLQMFVEVMRFGSYTDVARNRNVAPSSISRAILGLERELGVRLFQRSTRKLSPTEAAAVFYHRILPALREIDAAREATSDVSREPGGNLRVTAPAAFADARIVPLLPEFSERYPGLSVELIMTDAYLDLVEERIDIAVRLGSLPDSSVVARRLAPMRFYICASPHYLARHGTPDVPAQVGDHDCLKFPRAGYSLDWLFRDSDGNITEVPLDGRYQITYSGAIRQCAIAGMGLALLPDWLVDDALASGELVRLFEDYEVSATDFDSAIWMLYPSRAYLPLKSRTFIDFVCERFAQKEA